MGWRRRAYFDQCPGRGPYSYLPPWQRPGRVYGGGRGYGRWWSGNSRVCARYPWLPRWWWTDSKYNYQPSIATPTPQEEITALEESRSVLGEEKTSIEQEINDVEEKLKELKTKLETEKKQSTPQ
jgi:hypothetical protein